MKNQGVSRRTKGRAEGQMGEIKEQRFYIHKSAERPRDEVKGQIVVEELKGQ